MIERPGVLQSPGALGRGVLDALREWAGGAPARAGPAAPPGPPSIAVPAPAPFSLPPATPLAASPPTPLPALMLAASAARADWSRPPQSVAPEWMQPLQPGQPWIASNAAGPNPSAAAAAAAAAMADEQAAVSMSSDPAAAADPLVEEAVRVVFQRAREHGSHPSLRPGASREKQRKYVRAAFGYNRSLADAQLDAVCARLGALL